MARKVIIADDDEVIRSLIERHLRKRSLECDLCENAEQLLEKMKNTQYDLVLTDKDMPGMSGIEATRKIRKYDEKIKIYVMSAGDREIVEPLALQAGATGYLQKPFDREELYAIVDGLNPIHE